MFVISLKLGSGSLSSDMMRRAGALSERMMLSRPVSGFMKKLPWKKSYPSACALSQSSHVSTPPAKKPSFFEYSAMRSRCVCSFSAE